MRRPSPRTPSLRATTLGAVALTVLLLAVAVLASAPPASSQQPPESRSPAFELALEELQELERLDREAAPDRLTRSDLVARNLSRYFTAYVVPEDPRELERLLGTLQRITRDAGRILLGRASSVAQKEGADAIGERHLRRVVDALLPFEETDTGDRLFFPSLGEETVLAERWDLEALEATGMVWEVLGGLAQSLVEPSVAAGSGLDLTPEAAALLADRLNAYGLLVLDLGGEIARGDLAEAVATRHLRDAVKVLRARADGRSAPIADAYQLQRGESVSGPPLFVEVAPELGLDFEHRSSEWIGRFRRFGPLAPTFSGGGVAAGDVDGDGWSDLVPCGGRGCRLFVNEKGERFVDRSDDAGVVVEGEARMPVLADFDNDGDLDLFVTYVRDPNRLWLNDGSGTFRLSENTGLETEGDISGPAAAVDVDNDGLLDLYVGNFGNYLDGESPNSAQEARNGMPNRLYRNRGVRDGAVSFEDVTEEAGVGDTGWAQALSHFDADRDGDQDLYVANDFGRNQLYLNRGDGTFEAAGARTGSDDRFHGMNVSFADVDDDGLGDIFITNIWFWAAARREVTEVNTLLLSQPTDDGISYRRSENPSLREHDSGWAWAGLFFDVENDGDDDLFVANGFTDYATFIQYRPHPEDPDRLFAVNNAREPNLLFLGDGGFPDTLRANSGVELPDLNSRSAALLDFDRDGDLDLVVTTFHDRVRLLRNDSPSGGRSLRVELVGDPQNGVNRNAIGTQLQLRLDDGRTVWRTVTGGEGYLGMSDLPVEIGLGEAEPVTLEILWPNGDEQSVGDLPTGGVIRVRHGQPGFRPVVNSSADSAR